MHGNQISSLSVRSATSTTWNTNRREVNVGLKWKRSNREIQIEQKHKNGILKNGSPLTPWTCHILGVCHTANIQHTQQIIHHLESRPPTLLILDNLETAWESPGSCKEIEEFLALLTDIEHLALIVSFFCFCWGKLGFPKIYGGLKLVFAYDQLGS